MGWSSGRSPLDEGGTETGMGLVLVSTVDSGQTPGLPASSSAKRPGLEPGDCYCYFSWLFCTPPAFLGSFQTCWDSQIPRHEEELCRRVVPMTVRLIALQYVHASGSSACERPCLAKGLGVPLMRATQTGSLRIRWYTRDWLQLFWIDQGTALGPTVRNQDVIVHPESPARRGSHGRFYKSGARNSLVMDIDGQSLDSL